MHAPPQCVSCCSALFVLFHGFWGCWGFQNGAKMREAERAGRPAFKWAWEAGQQHLCSLLLLLLCVFSGIYHGLLQPQYVRQKESDRGCCTAWLCKDRPQSRNHSPKFLDGKISCLGIRLISDRNYVDLIYPNDALLETEGPPCPM